MSLVSENATSVEIEELLAELDLMKNMKPHENILNLLGQCTTPGMCVNFGAFRPPAECVS